jgi:anthranilate synthase/aminodeoxychorismate synthase-like glutamine amidotransferase
MSHHVLVIDNYDSFTYNLVQYLGDLGETVEVRRNDAVEVDEVAADRPLALVLSPGPKTPDEAGVCNTLIERFGPSLPILGVCLGHECIGAVYGATVGPAARLMHGKVSQVSHQGDRLFRGLPNPFEATRYHSLAVLPGSIPPSLHVTAWADDGTVMALRHRTHPVVGVQFHPESILTPGGRRLLANFIEDAHAWPR